MRNIDEKYYHFQIPDTEKNKNKRQNTWKLCNIDNNNWKRINHGQWQPVSLFALWVTVLESLCEADAGGRLRAHDKLIYPDYLV